MATPNSRATLKEYCLRSLGKPVIEINVAEEQIDIAINDKPVFDSQYWKLILEIAFQKFKIDIIEYFIISNCIIISIIII